ncbi:uncharacterized protein K441DRAFT_564563, partial [Cenococcum geophilum 1.58]|uniref:uncharacterized protein n=1 Tax=Cenococcum geophilum 1.58 TaxID=794803 RepID=UPI00358DE3B0
KDIKVRPILIGSTNIAALLIKWEARTLLAISIYIPAKSNLEDEEFYNRLNKIRIMIKTTCYNYKSQIELLIAGNFNRHD